MIARVSAIAAIASALAATLSAQEANQLFDVSLSGAPAVDLSPAYQQRIREATDAYRGDFPAYAVFSITRRVVTHRFPYPLTSALEVSPALLEDSDPFPRVPFTLNAKPEKITPRL